MKVFRAAACLLLLAAPADAQFGRILSGIDKARDVKKTVDSLTFSDAEERELGEQVSVLLREKYGVVQDAAVHRYVALAGTVLARASTRPNVPWTFIVLDTDGVNAFAAPGGFVHVTRGALALMQNEAELAGVLGHEIAHVTEKHTINAIRKSKLVEAGASATRNALIEAAATRTYEMLLENAYDRGDEMGADRTGVTLANSVGYAAGGLGAFLTRLAERNRDLTDRSGLFASHPDTRARLDALSRLVAAQKLASVATVAGRFKAAISYAPMSVTEIAAGEVGVSALSGSKPATKGVDTGTGKGTEPAPQKPPGGTFGLTGLNPVGREKAGQQTVASAGSRGVNPDRDARGGSNSALVTVPLSAAEVEAFRTGIV